MKDINDCFLWLNENYLYFIGIILLVGTTYSLKDNDLLFHKNTIKDYVKSISAVKKTFKKIITLNLVLIIFFIFFYENSIKYDTILTMISILTTAVLGILSIINSRDVVKYYNEKDSKKAVKPKRVSEVNSIANMTILISAILLIFTLIIQISFLSDYLFINKIIVFLTIFYLENLLVLIRKFTTIYINYLKANNY